MMNDSIQNTKELIISYFNNDEYCFSFSIVTNKPGYISMPIFIDWKYQVGNCTTKSSKASMVLIYSNYGNDDTNSIISLIRNKQATRIDIYAYNFTEEGRVDRGNTYQTSLSNSACKYIHFDLSNY